MTRAPATHRSWCLGAWRPVPVHRYEVGDGLGFVTATQPLRNRGPPGARNAFEHRYEVWGTPDNWTVLYKCTKTPDKSKLGDDSEGLHPLYYVCSLTIGVEETDDDPQREGKRR